MIAWRMWFNRNVVRHCHSRQSTEEVVQLARFLLNEFQTANHTISQAKDNSDDPWTLPLASNYKVNVDGAVFAQSQQAGVGVVIRDHDGRVTTTLSKVVHQPLRPLQMGAKAMEERVTFAWDVGIRDVIFEGDSKIISDALMGLGSPSWLYQIS